MKGLIIKGIGGFYYVKTDNGIIEAKGRGIFKKDGITLRTGDVVDIELMAEDDSKGVINKIYPRKNCFIRPPIANVDLLVIVFAAKNPRPNFPVIDKFLINAQINKIEPVICINKKDLVSDDEFREISDIYNSVYNVIGVSTKTGEGMDELLSVIKGQKTALAGPSGAGKSSIINYLHPEANMETGEVSKKTMRGKHTTRHVEIFELKGESMLFDTPGFTSFELPDMDEGSIKEYYPEFREFDSLCKYDNCNHISEPDCKVVKAVSEGRINKLRYEAYVSNYNEMKKRKKY